MIPWSEEARTDPTRHKPDPGFLPRIGGQLHSPAVDKRQEEIRQEVEDAAPGEHRLPGRRAPRRGFAAWGLEAARAWDLCGHSQAMIAESMEYTDHEWGQGQSRGVQRRVHEGRALLHDLGAWPWALYEGGVYERGVPPSRWWEREEALASLQRWWRDAACECIHDVLRAGELAAAPEAFEDGERPWAASETAWAGALRCLDGTP